MNASEILTKFETMVGDSLDQDFELQLANDAMHEVEEDVKREGLKAVDTTDSTFAGQTYSTASIVRFARSRASLIACSDFQLAPARLECGG